MLAETAAGGIPDASGSYSLGQVAVLETNRSAEGLFSKTIEVFENAERFQDEIRKFLENVAAV